MWLSVLDSTKHRGTADGWAELVAAWAGGAVSTWPTRVLQGALALEKRVFRPAVRFHRAYCEGKLEAGYCGRASEKSPCALMAVSPYAAAISDIASLADGLLAYPNHGN